MKWMIKKHENIGTSNVETTLTNAEITTENFLQIWDKFFKGVFAGETDKKWDSIRCEVWGDNWLMQLYPYDTTDHWGDIDKTLWVRFPEHYNMLNPLTKDDIVYNKHEDNLVIIDTVIINYLLHMMVSAFVDFNRTENIWSRPDMPVKTIRLYQYDSELFATITADGMTYENMTAS